jgi:hypothetical protein
VNKSTAIRDYFSGSYFFAHFCTDLSAACPVRGENGSYFQTNRLLMRIIFRKWVIKNTFFSPYSEEDKKAFENTPSKRPSNLRIAKGEKLSETFVKSRS